MPCHHGVGCLVSDTITGEGLSSCSSGGIESKGPHKVPARVRVLHAEFFFQGGGWILFTVFFGGQMIGILEGGFGLRGKGGSKNLGISHVYQVGTKMSLITARP